MKTQKEIEEIYEVAKTGFRDVAKGHDINKLNNLVSLQTRGRILIRILELGAEEMKHFRV
tara:strand:+ start:993 stop:1172 length:180 start_codon:yes stop_codon:yes gene_type:complete